MIGNINLYMGKTASTKKVNQGKQNNDKLKKQHHNDFCQQFRSEKKSFGFPYSVSSSPKSTMVGVSTPWGLKFMMLGRGLSVSVHWGDTV